MNDLRNHYNYREGIRDKHNEENLSTKYDQQKEDARIFAADEHQRGKVSFEAQKG
jgi:hypothetical protein